MTGLNPTGYVLTRDGLVLQSELQAQIALWRDYARQLYLALGKVDSWAANHREECSYGKSNQAINASAIMSAYEAETYLHPPAPG